MRKSRPNFQLDPTLPIVRTHCHSAFGGPWPPFTPAERDEFMRDIYASADFSEVKIVAFSIQPTCFDLIIDIPRQLSLPKEEMLRRFKDFTDDMFFAVEGKRLKEDDPQAWARLSSRFGDLSHFIKNIKQRAAHRYHKAHDSSGRLWGERFTRAFVQTGHPSRVLAAWMDHSAVRLGDAATPDEDRYSTFGRAVSGDVRARTMIAALFTEAGDELPWRSVAKAYRDFVAGDVEVPFRQRDPKGRGVPLLTRREFLLSEVPHFRGGVALGDREFAEGVFELNRADFGAKRTSGARRISGQNDPDLWTLRNKGDLRD